jgi:hypothetical protein
MKTVARDPAAFSPGLSAGDPLANHWLRQVMLRLRREVCWAWQERGAGPPAAGAPPFVDRLSDSLDRARYFEEKQRFFRTDATAVYLGGQIAAEPPLPRETARGTFDWVVEEAGLDPVGCFLLALGLTASFDSAAGPVIAACHNDASRTSPTLALVQRLWDSPEEALALADPGHPLFRFGLLRRLETTPGVLDWDAPLGVHELVARRLLFPAAAPPYPLARVEASADGRAQAGKAAPLTLGEPMRQAALGLRAPSVQMRVVPVLVAHGGSGTALIEAVSDASGRQVVAWRGTSTAHSLAAALVLCWLDGTDLLLRVPLLPDKVRLADMLMPLAALPVNVFVVAADRAPLEGVPDHLLSAALEAPPLSHAQRVACWRRELGPRADGLDDALQQAARRFRYEPETIGRIAQGLRAVPGPLDEAKLTTACRQGSGLEVGDLAQRVSPRFDRPADLVLPAPQRRQFEEVLQAMRALTEVHYRWGTARVWNEGGISVLFAGPSGTGKTMAAEILASELGLPMYRIDLSQVVSKYIGETEKNLKRIFDAADLTDTLLLFDEADSIFGKRLEARDAHDRYANLEISYLLERMERFKGLAVLATNRKKDLDEAFLRRLRYVLDFPLPGPRQRLHIWRHCIPEGVDATGVDLEFLASRFALAGGHIRSSVFNACLQSAGRTERPVLTMEAVLVAVKRELDKVNRQVGLELFGGHAELIRALEDAEEDGAA